MGIIEDGLAPEERLLLHRHPHWKSIILAILVGVIATSAAIYLLVLLLDWDVASLWKWILGIALGVTWVAVMSWWSIAPLIRWGTTHFAITNRRLMFRTGVFTKTGIDIPLARVSTPA